MFVVMAVPLVCVVVLLVGDARHNRRVRANPERTVAGIRQRLKAEQAEAKAASAPTEVLPRIQLAPADELTGCPQPLALSKRPRAYRRRPSPYPRTLQVKRVEMDQYEEAGNTGGERPRDDVAARISEVTDDLARTASALRRAVEERAAPDGAIALVARIEGLVARMQPQTVDAASDCEELDGEDT